MPRRAPVVAFVLLAAAVTSARPPRRGHGARVIEPVPTHRIVGGTVDLSPKVGAKMMAQLLAGTPVRRLRAEGADFVRVETLGSVRLVGVVRTQALGLRVVRPVDLLPGAGARPVRLDVGADLRVLALRGKKALVETVGVVVKGTCPRAALAVVGPEHVDTPPGGPLFRLKRAVILADPVAPERPLARLDAGEEVVGLLDDGTRARVRTYGPIALEGVVPRDALVGREPKQVTLERTDGVDCEVAIDTDLFEKPGGKVIGRVRGGTPAVLEGEVGDFVRIVTAGDVRTRGVVAKQAVTRLTPMGEWAK